MSEVQVHIQGDHITRIIFTEDEAEIFFSDNSTSIIKPVIHTPQVGYAAVPKLRLEAGK